ncbi:molybdopterin cofactor-binding domain-containing protein [Nocardioides iriomotensis]|uniref:Xanthine dehydrogenase family protein molybdopterin-binding subunit n=1 Tax=Nocardioides iriomotensis TaxID=715784 RepID=A0A4Q5ISY3_9ACTN|nr:molybdopterin cofactor-binding domain-containing protein [Nocardioides iriomotensis]RYU08763.1 xanthine dehydrogenase family protein molybdopterin-binding subunit [Nocardioides iriomotensis]
MSETAARAARPRTEADPGRRRFLGYLLAAPTLAAAADLSLGTATAPPALALPSGPQPAEVYDLNDMLTDATRPTANLITVVVHEDGTASFELPRSENGQGIMTSSAMLVAEELDLPVSKVRVTLADARPELLFNQLTGGSNTTISTFTPIRVAAAIAKQELLAAAAIVLSAEVESLEADAGVITAPGGASVGYGQLARRAAATSTRRVDVTLTDRADFKVIGTPHNRTDARKAVTGRKEFTLDLQVKGARPTMVCRAPTLNGTPVRVRNKKKVLAMPGITHVAKVSTGVAVRGKTFGQVIRAVRALDVEWKDGPVAGQSDADVLAELRAAELPLAVPALPAGAKTVDADFTFWFRSNSALEPNCAIADVRTDRAEIWAGLKSPITAHEEIATRLGMTPDQVTVHVVQGGGSFGRKLFFDAALEAAEISQKMRKPVKLMWHRTDDSRVGRTHPMATSRIRATYAGSEVLSFEQRHTSVVTDNSHGLGELITAMSAKLPVGEIGFAQTIFALTQEVPYHYGLVDQQLDETDSRFNTGSMRNIYSPDTCTARELVTDQLAEAMGQDAFAFRREHAKDDRARAVLATVAEVGGWGRRMPAGTAQGIALHKEYKGLNACLVEIDCRPATVDRPVRDGVTGPRVTKVVMAVDVGLAVNPRGLEAQMQGGIMDGIALALTSSLHLRDGHFLEGSWDNYFYTRQWNVPPEVEVVVMPDTTGEPGGAGEFGVASTFAAVACAYRRATGRTPTEFPINHRDPLAFKPKPTVPPIPQSPTNGLRRY